MQPFGKDGEFPRGIVLHLGAPSMNLDEFQQLRNNPRMILGMSIKVQLPTGQYMTDRFINVGTNRWAFKPEFGSLIPLFQKLILEVVAGAWFFTRDNDYVTGTRKQQPVLSGEIHLVKRFKPGLWASLEGNYFWSLFLQFNGQFRITLKGENPAV